MNRLIVSVFVVVLGASLALVPEAWAQNKKDKIKSAMAAAPASISAEATVADWPAEPGGEMPILREGTNGWLCLPDNPGTDGEDSMCLDAPWQNWVTAWINKGTPDTERMGFGYMLRGDAPVSNTDPYAEGPTDDNEWIPNGKPHLMIIVPDAEVLAGLPVDPDQGGPWVMWRGTPFAHIMAPMPKHRPPSM